MRKCRLPTGVLGNQLATGYKEAKEGRVHQALREIPLTRIHVASTMRAGEGDVQDLAASIKAQGLLQPVVVQALSGRDADSQADAANSPVGHVFQLLFGHRRLQAFHLLGRQEPEKWRTIMAIELPVDTYDEQEIVAVQIVENLQRVDLQPAELQAALVYLREKGLSAREIAGCIGMSVGYVNNLFSIVNNLEAHPEVAEAVKVHAGVGFADLQEVRPLPARLQVALLREKADGHIPNREALRQRVSELRAQLDGPIMQGSLRKVQRTTASLAGLWREGTDGVIRCRSFAVDPRTTDSRERSEIVVDLKSLVARMEIIAQDDAKNAAGHP